MKILVVSRHEVKRITIRSMLRSLLNDSQHVLEAESSAVAATHFEHNPDIGLVIADANVLDDKCLDWLAGQTRSARGVPVIVVDGDDRGMNRLREKLNNPYLVSRSSSLVALANAMLGATDSGVHRTARDMSC